MELDQSKLNSILMELDVLHKSQSPYIVDFYGAFFIETCVYYCMEFMDAGSLDKLYQIGVPEDILATVTLSVTFFEICHDIYASGQQKRRPLYLQERIKPLGRKFKMSLDESVSCLTSPRLIAFFSFACNRWSAA